VPAGPAAGGRRGGQAREGQRAERRRGHHGERAQAPAGALGRRLLSL
jgi:hypothetical protein